MCIVTCHNTVCLPKHSFNLNQNPSCHTLSDLCWAVPENFLPTLPPSHFPLSYFSTPPSNQRMNKVLYEPSDEEIVVDILAGAQEDEDDRGQPMTIDPRLLSKPVVHAYVLIIFLT